MKNQGPKLITLTTCSNCEYLDEILDGKRCRKLKNYVFKDYSNYIRPHESCPFLKSEKEMLENKLAEIEAEESKKLKTSLLDLFSGHEYNIDGYTNEIFVMTKETINLDNLIEFRRILPDFDLKIEACDCDLFQIRVLKKSEK